MFRMKKRLFLGSLVLFLIISSTLLSFHLTPTVKANPTLEDFTTYTEIDPNSHITKNAAHIDFYAYGGEDAYVYKDAGVDHFGTSWEHKIDVKAIAGVAAIECQVWTLANLVDDIYGIQLAGGDALTVILYLTGATYYIYIKEYRAGNAYTIGYGITVNTPYYLTLKRDGTAFTCKIYSNSARTTLLTTLSLTLHAGQPSHRYVYASQTNSYYTSGKRLDCDIDNLDLQEGGGYALNLRVMDWDLTGSISGAIVYKDTDTKTSNGGGWANWTGVSGTVQIKVKYFGFWVNGSFSVTMDADKTRNVKCKLYDVTVTAKTNNEVGVISGANVTAYNNTGTASGKIKSGITVDTTGQVTLTNVPNATLRFIMYAKSDYSIIIANITQLISSDDYSFNIVANLNYAVATLSFGYEAIIWMSSLSFLPFLTVISFMVHKKLKKRNGGEKACMQEKHV